MRLELDRVRRASALLGDPAARFPSIHIAGTNGKGSVAAMLDSILRAAGLRVGLYTSPHLHRFTERIRVSGREITHADVALGLGAIERVLGRPGAPELTFFEVVTLLALRHFARARVEVAVVEVGLGGRLDATQLVNPVASVVTRIGLDHCDRLGSTIAAIAREKAGIVRPGVPVVTGVEGGPAWRILRARCREQGAPLDALGRDFEAKAAPAGIAYSGPGGDLGPMRVGLGGSFQVVNAALAVAAARAAGLGVDDRAVRRGLARVRWPGRFEIIGARPRVILDVAHNSDGAEGLARALSETAGPRSVELVFGVLGDKDAAGMLRALEPFARRVIFTRPPLGRAREPSELARQHPGDVVPDVRDALRCAVRRAGANGTVLVTGSIFTVAEARRAILGRRVRADPPIGL
ncbi:MAG: bifunctional folylpolyglutamate synthase/dihydrofolate synthase [Deltaproteobacteria bacterium]|nr:bifunctional folylpolyglutamate synthase/dihydrofolate synthase [Deltaproteobacteria bacterium]